ncbi:UvrD-helicase domain-containing protein [Paenibacillus polymyxa]|uniref:UvrD-helicase domain-containing protein n=1 Tax=Paenibacillus polymyxa TaxID=1406 RepID=UPI00129B306F|nr:UvrD-helicase domain-containing protein [Paenibacillus polymyxa]KAE8560415.1 DNA helicase UvrD [Paenibacillus polymyxa]
MNPNPAFYPRPIGVPYSTTSPQARRASMDTSITLVPDSDQDAAYFRAIENAGIHLNRPQIQAVRHGKGPLLTLAGAGCGKTTVLAARAGYLMAMRDVPASSILLVTFTSKAAAEMKLRIAGLPGVRPAAARAVQARTFHSFALAMLRHRGVQDEVFGETQAQHTVMKMMLRQLGLSEAFQPESLLSALSAWKAEGRSADELPETMREEADAKRAMLAYEAWKQERNKMDFDDILLRASVLLRDPDVLQPLQRRFSYIMVDEFQDTNALQYEMVQRLAARHRNLMVVGDDDQTIYTFNGARQDSILEFDKVYKDAKVITLDINYRSDARILGLGSNIVAKNVHRRSKRLAAAGREGLPPQFATPSGPEEEAGHIVTHLLGQVEEGRLRYRDIAILHRTASGSRSIFEQLIMRDVPFIQYGAGAVFYDQSLIRPLMDHLRLSLNPRRMESIPSTLGPLYVSREAGMEWIMREEKKQAKKYPLIHLSRWDRLRDFQREQVKERIRLIRSLTTMKPAYAIQEMRRVFYDKYLESGDTGAWTHYKETMQESLEELETAAKRFDTVEAFVNFADELSERHRQMESLRREEDSDAVRLMTIHRAKGLEFPCVYWIGASEGILPHSSALHSELPEDRRAGAAPATAVDNDAALEEERRLAYVAVTRAKELLYITSPASNHGKPAAVSRFLLEAYGVTPEVSKPETRRSSFGQPKGTSGYGSRAGGGSPISGTATRVSSRPGPAPATPTARTASAAAKSQTEPRVNVPVWKCTDAACKAWMRRDTVGGRRTTETNAGTPPVCPLCSSPMTEGTRNIPAR